MSAAHFAGLPLEELLPALSSAGAAWLLVRTMVLARLGALVGGGAKRTERSPE
jgi:hypothetical protein